MNDPNFDNNTSDAFINFTQTPPEPGLTDKFEGLNLQGITGREPTTAPQSSNAPPGLSKQSSSSISYHHSKSSSNDRGSFVAGEAPGSPASLPRNGHPQPEASTSASGPASKAEVPDPSADEKPQESNITASGIPMSNTLNASGSISYLPGTASLVEEVDKKQLVILRDGRMLIGILRSVDQFANLVLQQTSERVLVNNEFCDIERGWQL